MSLESFKSFRWVYNLYIKGFCFCFWNFIEFLREFLIFQQPLLSESCNVRSVSRIWTISMKKWGCLEAVNFALFISLGCKHYESVKEACSSWMLSLKKASFSEQASVAAAACIRDPYILCITCQLYSTGTYVTSMFVFVCDASTGTTNRCCLHPCYKTYSGWASVMTAW